MQATVTDQDVAVLTLLGNRQMHTGAIVREMNSQSSSVHTLVKRMHERGLIEAHYIEETGSRSGLRPGELRKVWGVGPIGQLALQFHEAMNVHVQRGEEEAEQEAAAAQAVHSGAGALPSREEPPEIVAPSALDGLTVNATEPLDVHSTDHAPAPVQPGAPLGIDFSGHTGLEQ